MKKAIDILYAAGKEGAEISLKGEDLSIRVPKERSLSKELVQQIRENKQSIIEVLRNNLNAAEKEQRKITKADRQLSVDTPLSYSQERLWFVHQLEGSRQYHLTSRLLLKGKLNVEALTYALKTVVERHEVLRTILLENNGKPYQHVIPAANWQMQLVEVAEENAESEIDLLVNESDNVPFDLAKDYMLRAILFKMSDEAHQLMITMHHVASDAWSLPIIVQEVTFLYQSFEQQNATSLPPLPLQFSDFAIWERSYLSKEQLDVKLDYWKRKLKDVEALQLPTDFTRPAIRGTQGASVKSILGADVTKQLHKLANQQGCTLYMLLMAVYKVLLYRYTNQNDIAVGASLANRSQDEIKGLVGFFVNTLTFRSQVNGDDAFIDLLQQVKQTNLEAYQHSDVPFEKVVEAVLKERDPSRSPLFQVMLVFNNTPKTTGIVAGDLLISEVENNVPVSKFDFTFFVSENNGELFLNAEYNRELFTKETMSGMLSHYIALLNAVVKNPHEKVGRLQLMEADQEQSILDKLLSANTQVSSQQNVVALFEEQVKKTPGATAVVFEKEQLTFSELNAAANQLAHLLQSKIKKENIPVPVFIQRNHHMVIALLGILKAGHAYVPIEVDTPESRLSFLLDDLGSPVIVSVSNDSGPLSHFEHIEVIDLDGDQLQMQPKNDLHNSIDHDDLAYVIYTSGSTGKPKGVMVSHANLIDYVVGLDATLGIGSSKSYALVSSFATDLGNTVVYSALLLGGALHIISKQNVTSSHYLFQYFKDHSIDSLKIVPSHYRALCNEAFLLPAKFLIFGGEALPTQLVQNILAANPTCTIVNHYGPTETTIGKLLHVVDPNATYGHTIPLGKPFSNTAVAVFSSNMQVCPIGVPGQLFIAGAGVAKGYLNNDELTHQKFITYNHNQQGAVRMYATGDLVKSLPGGAIEFIGRVDDQVKIRGYRVELGEIENILRQCNGVQLCAVVAKEDKSGVKKLIAYYTADDTTTAASLETHLTDALPDYMVPAAFIMLEEMPLMINGKIDKKALPDPDLQHSSTVGFVAPETEAQQKMAEIWCSILEEETIGIHDDFFELGGHSLLAVRLVSAIRKAFGVEIPISHIFDFPTICLLTEELTTPAAFSALPAIKAMLPRPVDIPLSFSQQRLWFIDKMEGSLQYHVPAVFQLSGALDRTALELALQTIVDRHEVLRTVFREADGNVYQVVTEPGKWKLTYTEGAHFIADEPALEKHIHHSISQPFLLATDAMLRAELIALSSEDHILILTLHHIASDGWSRSILVKEFTELYNAASQNRAAVLNTLPVQYADYSLWQNEHIAGDLLQQKLSYWKEKLNNVEPLQLPVDRARQANQGKEGSEVSIKMDQPLVAALNKLSKQHGSTLFMTLLAAFKTLLYRYTGQHDICVGTPVAGRQHQELEPLIGFFLNTLAIRSQVQPAQSFIELLQQVRTNSMEAFAHQEVPFEKVVEAVIKNRDQSSSPLFQVMFMLQNTPDVKAPALEQITLQERKTNLQTARFELSLSLTEIEGELHGSLEYNKALFNAVTIERLVGHFVQLLAEIVADPAKQIDAYQMISSAERTRLLEDFNQTKTVLPTASSVIDLFEEKVITDNQSVALIVGDRSYTYYELNDLANRAAAVLLQQGVKPADVVPVYMERSAEMVVGLLAILKVGGVYVPLDPDYPADRIQYIIEDISAKWVVTTQKFAAAFEEAEALQPIIISSEENAFEAAGNPVRKQNKNDLFCIVYTSGSTGRPKGVQLNNANVLNRLFWMMQAYPFAANERVAIKTSIGFVDHISELFSPLIAGVPGVIFSKDDLLDIDQLLNKFLHFNISRIVLVPSLLKAVVERIKTNAVSLPTLKYWTSSGEPISGELVKSFYELFPPQDYKLLNIYGSSEVTADVTYHDTSIDFTGLNNSKANGVQRTYTPAIGKPIANCTVYLLDDAMQLVPQGCYGEICIGGTPVSPGYYKNEILTAQRFVADPFNTGSTLFKTGDLARWLPNGNLEYAGRKDDQVKIRGNRVEPGEVESLLMQSGLVTEVAVVVKKDSDNNNLLAAYIVAGDFDKQAAIQYLHKKCPAYMVPSTWVIMQTLPLTPSGKVDKRALAAEKSVAMPQKEYVAPTTDTELALANIWQQLLQLDQVGIEDNFFELGGHSLMMIRLVSAIKKKFAITVPIASLFQFTTIQSLANYIDWESDTVNEADSNALEILNL